MLAAASSLVMVTVARPLVRAVVVAWADDNPAALRIRVRRGHGPRGHRRRPHAPRADGSTDEIAFTVESGDTPATVAPSSPSRASSTASARSCSRPGTADLGAKLTAGSFGLAGNLTPAQVVEGLVANRITSTTSP